MALSDFGSYIKGQRKALGWTLRQAAAHIGVSSSRLAEIERGKSYHTDHATRPTRELAERIAQAYDLPMDIVLAEAGFPLRSTPDLTPESTRLLAMFETLPPEKRHIVLGILHVFVESEGRTDSGR